MKHAAATLGSGKTLHYICTDYQRNENVRLFFFWKKKNLACVLLFDTVHLLFLKIRDLIFNISLNKIKLSYFQ